MYTSSNISEIEKQTNLRRIVVRVAEKRDKKWPIAKSLRLFVKSLDVIGLPPC